MTNSQFLIFVIHWMINVFKMGWIENLMLFCSVSYPRWGSNKKWHLYSHHSYCYPNCTMVRDSQDSKCKNWATRLSIRSFPRTAHSFYCSARLALHVRSAALTPSVAYSLTPSLVGKWMIRWLFFLSFSSGLDHKELERLLKNRALPLFSLISGGSFHCLNLLETLNEFCLDALKTRSTALLDTTFQ